MKIASSEHVVYINCSGCQNKKQFVYTTCSELAIFMFWTRNSMNNLLLYCWLVDAKISASDQDLPVQALSNLIFCASYWSFKNIISVQNMFVFRLFAVYNQVSCQSVAGYCFWDWLFKCYCSPIVHKCTWKDEQSDNQPSNSGFFYKQCVDLIRLTCTYHLAVVRLSFCP